MEDGDAATFEGMANLAEMGFLDDMVAVLWVFFYVWDICVCILLSLRRKISPSIPLRGSPCSQFSPNSLD